MSGETRLLSIMGHILELRSRLIKCAIAVIICSIVTFIFADYIINFFEQTAPEEIEFIFTETTGSISLHMKVALIGGIALAMPILVYHTIMFASPGLTRREKKYVYLILPWIILMFAGGIAFAYFILVPPATDFLLNYRGFDLFGLLDDPLYKAYPTINDYISLVTRFMLAIGVSFEMPVIITFLARIGVVKPEWLSKNRRWAIVIAFIVAAIITPTPDPFNQTLVAGPLIVLYEMSIWLAKLAYRKRAEAEA